MTKRGLITTIIALVGLGLMVVSYLFWTTPVCNTSVECSDPRVPFAAGIFVLGVLIAFTSGAFYSVYKGDR